jgi:hypothetical protein
MQTHATHATLPKRITQPITPYTPKQQTKTSRRITHLAQHLLVVHVGLRVGRHDAARERVVRKRVAAGRVRVGVDERALLLLGQLVDGGLGCWLIVVVVVVVGV